VGLEQSGGVVDTVANEGGWGRPLEFLYLLGLLPGQYTCVVATDAKLARHGGGYRLSVAGDHHRLHARVLQRLHRKLRALSYAIGQADDSESTFPVHERYDALPTRFGLFEGSPQFGWQL